MGLRTNVSLGKSLDLSYIPKITVNKWLSQDYSTGLPEES
jgi:hypothetical protein